jgi:hypothetical protein
MTSVEELWASCHAASATAFLQLCLRNEYQLKQGLLLQHEEERICRQVLAKRMRRRAGRRAGIGKKRGSLCGLEHRNFSRAKSGGPWQEGEGKIARTRTFPSLVCMDFDPRAKVKWVLYVRGREGRVVRRASAPLNQHLHQTKVDHGFSCRYLLPTFFTHNKLD